MVVRRRESINEEHVTVSGGMVSSAGKFSGSSLVAGTFYGFLVAWLRDVLEAVHDQHAATLGGWCGMKEKGTWRRSLPLSDHNLVDKIADQSGIEKVKPNKTASLSAVSLRPTPQFKSRLI
ncbi:hypothetical protein ONS95_009134 [Cadophora gregata]|uniref:uncharacterized protein n=1 Tax=Cadophora gregata TaxID=51156 RepID=UPI0026DCEC77|nr:uncharacterized protein ONS95_009134 [Cadophora gregata]KAK0124151.1 hypothetical protein ONS95_009134 [Cadophora gregata]